MQPSILCGLYCFLYLWQACLYMPVAAFAENKPEKDKDIAVVRIASLSPASSVKEGSEFMAAMTRAAENLDKYSFRYKMTVYKGSRKINDAGNFWFRKPRMLRVESTGDYKRGAVAVLGEDGKVRGHLGGVLKSFVATVKPDSDWVMSSNGYPMVESDYASIMQNMNKYQQEGRSVQVSAQPLMIDGFASPVYIFEMYTTKSVASRIYKRVYVDAKSKLPVEWFDYKNGKLFAHTVWTDFKKDIALDDSLFKL